MTTDSRGQIYAALIGAGLALAIAVAGFVHQNGQISAHLEGLEYRERRIEGKVDLVYDEVVDLRERTARIEERITPRDAAMTPSLRCPEAPMRRQPVVSTSLAGEHFLRPGRLWQWVRRGRTGT